MKSFLTARQKHALELVERLGVGHAEAARQTGLRDPDGNGRVTFSRLVARARAARAREERMIREYLGDR